MFEFFMENTLISILGLLLFLIYINDLSDDLTSNPKLLADEASLFSAVKNIDNSGIDLNNDLRIINKWAFQWQMSFNPDPTKQAEEVVFSGKTMKLNHPLLFFNGNPVVQTDIQRHLGMFLDTKLSFLII